MRSVSRSSRTRAAGRWAPAAGLARTGDRGLAPDLALLSAAPLELRSLARMAAGAAAEGGAQPDRGGDFGRSGPRLRHVRAEGPSPLALPGTSGDAVLADPGCEWAGSAGQRPQHLLGRAGRHPGRRFL